MENERTNQNQSDQQSFLQRFGDFSHRLQEKAAKFVGVIGLSRVSILTNLFIVLSFAVSGQKPLIVLPVGHTKAIVDANISIDQKKIVTASEDNTAKIWDGTGKLLKDLPHGNAVNSAVFSKDGKSILTADGDAYLWNAENGSLIRKFEPFQLEFTYPDNQGNLVHLNLGIFPDQKAARLVMDSIAKRMPSTRGGFTGSYSALALKASFGPDEKTFLTLSQDSSARLWDITTGKLLRTFKKPDATITSAAFNYDGTMIVTVGEDNAALIWETASGNIFKTIRSDNRILTAALHPDGKSILVADDFSLRLINVATNGLIREFEVHSPLKSVSFNPDGKSFMVTSLSDPPTIYELGTGKERKVGTNISTHACYSSNGKKLVVAAVDGITRIFDARSGQELASISGTAQSVKLVVFSSDAKYILTSATDNTQVLNGTSYTRIWDATNGQPVSTLHYFEEITSAEFSNNGELVLTLSNNGNYRNSTPNTVYVWKVQSGKLLFSFHLYSTVNTAVFFPDNRYILATTNSAAYVLDYEADSILLKIEPDTSSINSAAVSKDGKLLLTTFNDTKTQIWDVSTGKLLREFSNKNSPKRAIFSPDSKNIVTYYFDSATNKDSIATLSNAHTGEIIKELQHSGKVIRAEFVQDGTRLVTESDDRKIKLWTGNGTYLSEFEGEQALISPDGTRIAAIYNSIFAEVNGDFEHSIRQLETTTGKPLSTLHYNKQLLNIAFDPSSSRIASVASNNSTCIWDLDSSQPVYCLYTLDSSDYFIQSIEEFYMCTPAMAKLLHYVTTNLKVITFDQLDIRFNRPDKVLAAMGSRDTLLINSYRHAWLKRIKKLEVDTLKFTDLNSIPVADIVNQEELDFEQKNEFVKLRIRASDKTEGLDRFNVQINEVPLYSQKGINIRHCGKLLDTTITLQLSHGKNSIEVYVTNLGGLESYRTPLSLYFNPSVNKQEMIWFVGIGIDQFAENKYNLQFSVKDIRDLAKKLKKRFRDNIKVDTLFNKDVTIQKVELLKKKLMRTGINDKVILAYSGHGLLSKNFDYFLSTYNVNFQNPEENGLPYDRLEHLVDGIPARKKVMLIDACHSGEIDKDEFVRQSGLADSLGLIANKKGLIVSRSESTNRLGLKNSFELMQSLFIDVGKSTGTVVISAAAGTQFALERNDLRNGVFTYSILDAFEEHQTLKVSELKSIVARRVHELTRGMQRPTARRELMSADWTIW